MNLYFSLNGLESKTHFEHRGWTNLNFPLHCHYTFEAIFVTSGTIIIEKENQAYTLSKNDALVIMPFETHKVITPNASEIYTTQMSTNLISCFDTLFKGKTLKNPCCHLSASEFDDIYRHLQLAEDNLVEINYVFFAIMSSFLRNNELIAFHEYEDLFRKVILYTSNHFEENLTLKDIAKDFNVSYVYLSRIFTDKSGMKFNDFLNSFRMQKAMALLADPAIPVSEICYACGFGSLRNFNRVFSKVMSCTPKEYRQNINSII